MALTPLVLVALLAVLAVAPGAAQAKRGMEVALQDDGALVYGTYPGVSVTQAIDRAAALGVTRIRSNLSWAKALDQTQVTRRAAPARPKYNWGPWDALIDAAAARGIRVHLTLAGFAPAYATSNHKVGVTSPNPRRFGQFARAAARHFKGRVDTYSIWNEPNIKPQLAPLSRNAAIYRKLYTAGYKAVKRADRKAKVLIGETNPYGIRGRATDPLKFLRKLACVTRRYHKVGHCRKLVADGYAHHPYDFKHKPTFRYPGADNATVGTLGHLTKALTRLARAHALTTPSGRTPYVYLTEYGYYANGPRKLPEAKRARYLVKGFSIAYHNPRVKSMLAYLLVVPPPDTSSFPLGLIRRDNTPLRSYTALKRWKGKAHVKHRPARIRLPAAR